MAIYSGTRLLQRLRYFDKFIAQTFWIKSFSGNLRRFFWGTKYFSERVLIDRYHWSLVLYTTFFFHFFRVGNYFDSFCPCPVNYGYSGFILPWAKWVIKSFTVWFIYAIWYVFSKYCSYIEHTLYTYLYLYIYGSNSKCYQLIEIAIYLPVGCPTA